jgi:hypothetical protein
VFVPIGIFLATRVIDAVMLLVALPQQYPASSLKGDPGSGVPIARDPHSYWNVIQQWDGQWFRLIAEHGYPQTLPVFHGAVAENQWAFYPLFPSLVRAVMLLTHTSYAVSATLVNLMVVSAGMCVLYRMVWPRASSFTAAMTVVVVATFPSAVVFQAAYSDGLAFFLVVSSLSLLNQRRYPAVLLTGVLLSLTRAVVLPLALVVCVHGLVRWRTRTRDPFPVRDRIQVTGLAGLLVLSFGIWPAVAWIVTGERNAYLTSLAAWNRALGQTTSTQSWLSQAFSGNWFVLVVIAAAVAAQSYLLLRRDARLWAPELRQWSFAYAGYLFLATRPQWSFLRHMVLAIVPWWPFPEMGHQVESTRRRWLLGCTVAALGILAQFFWIRWFWIYGPHRHFFP